MPAPPARPVHIRTLSGLTRGSFEPSEHMPMSAEFADEALRLFDGRRDGVARLAPTDARALVMLWLADRGCAPRPDGSHGLCPGYDAVVGARELVVRAFPGGARDAAWQVVTYASFLVASARNARGRAAPPPRPRPAPRRRRPESAVASAHALRSVEWEAPDLLALHYLRALTAAQRRELRALHERAYLEARGRLARKEPLAQFAYGPGHPPICAVFDPGRPAAGRVRVAGLAAPLDFSLECLRPGIAAGVVRAGPGPTAAGAARAQVRLAVDRAATGGCAADLDCSALQGTPGSAAWSEALLGVQTLATWYRATTILLHVSDPFTAACATALRREGRLACLETQGDYWTIHAAG